MRKFGIRAFLAFAMVAVCSSLAGCYDSEHLDVTQPYTPSKPLYVINGYVYDFVTGQALKGVTVKVAALKDATTDNMGHYTFESDMPVVNDHVKFSLDGYQPAERYINMKTSTTGVVSYTVDCYLIKNDDVPGIQILTLDTPEAYEEFTSKKAMSLDIVNESASSKDFSLKITHLQKGARFVDSSAAADAQTLQTKAEKRETELPEAAKQVVGNWFKKNFGTDPNKGFEYGDEYVTVTLPANSYLNSADLTQSGMVVSLLFTFDGVDYAAMVESVTGFSVDWDFDDYSHYHGHAHGHGHGHGDSWNAGGGIFED